MSVNEERQMGRARNAVMSYMERHLSVPKIYLDAVWEHYPVPVLAIDRDGVGDVHAVLLFARKFNDDGSLAAIEEIDAIARLIEDFSKFHAHFKYIGGVDIDSRRYSSPLKVAGANHQNSFAADGIGRIGFFRIEVPDEGEPKATLEIKPERFRAAVTKLADEYVEQHTADWEIRA
jgi:hypothetical protein